MSDFERTIAYKKEWYRVMKRIVVPIFMVCLFMMLWTTGCTDRKSVADSTSVDTFTVDSAAVDTLEQLISEEPMPKAADELFDDFIFNFAANSKLQYRRIKFPLTVKDGDNISVLKKSQWETEHFFMEQGYYTLIFDNKRQMRAVKDTSVNNVVIEKIYLDKDKVKKYNFERINGHWMLTSIVKSALSHSADASFLSFYNHFVTDSAFQVKSLNDPVMFTGPDPDDDFSTMSGEIAPETWPAFAPELPSGLIYNIIYGSRSTNGSNKIFMLRGISNGQEMTMTFSRKSGKWMLMSLSE